MQCQVGLVGRCPPICTVAHLARAGVDLESHGCTSVYLDIIVIRTSEQNVKIHLKIQK